jgi:tRNA/rRNA methyltransferase
MLENIRIVLVRPKRSGNIGATARAMGNMGVHDLALVSPARINRFWADTMAVHAKEVLAHMRIHATLREAVADCGLIVGTTCRGGLYRDWSLAPRAMAPEIVTAACTNRVALVFGPEDHGLSNDDLRLCQRLITIPSHPTYPFLNVAQAVLLCCYEIFLAATHEEKEEGRLLVSAERMELMYEKLKGALLKIGFLHSDNPEHIMFAFRRIFGRAGLEDRDVRILLGLAHQIVWYADSGWEVRAEPEIRQRAANGKEPQVGGLKSEVWGSGVGAR